MLNNTKAYNQHLCLKKILTKGLVSTNCKEKKGELQIKRRDIAAKCNVQIHLNPNLNKLL